MLFENVQFDAHELATRSGWQLKPEGACKGSACVPLPQGVDGPGLAERLGMAVVTDPSSGLVAVGPESFGSVLKSVQLPDVELIDRHGAPVRLRSLIGPKLVIVAWASWCGCRLDLPQWQQLREELRSDGVEIVTVALDAGGPEAAGPHIDAAAAQHPALIDPAHQLVRELGFVNVPMAVWVDESGRIVRPAEAAWPGRAVFWEPEAYAEMSEMAGQLDAEWTAQYFGQAARIVTDQERYVTALRDWAKRGADSDWVLSPEEVQERSASRTRESSAAGAHAELALHLQQVGQRDAAVRHFREAHRLEPDNWSYKRQAWSQEDVLQRPTGAYDSDFVTDIKALGPENYYRPSVGRKG